MTRKPFALFFSVLRMLLHRRTLSVPLDMNAHAAATRGGWPFDLMAPDL